MVYLRGGIWDGCVLFGQILILWGVTFLWPNKKVTKEIGIGEALTVKPFGTSSIDHLFYPNFKPPSPMYPSRPPSKDMF